MLVLLSELPAKKIVASAALTDVNGPDAAATWTLTYWPTRSFTVPYWKRVAMRCSAPSPRWPTMNSLPLEIVGAERPGISTVHSASSA